jgi:teichuronic acid exporter
MVRQVALQIITFGGGIVLARVLGPSKFGLYAIASFLVNIFAMFGDFGLAPSLIQRKEEILEDDLRVAFTLQQIITGTIVATIMLLAPWLAHFYPKAPPEMPWLVRALALSLFLNSWRTMSKLQLERRLKYDNLAKVEVLESLAYQAIAVVLALTRHGVWSYIYAILGSAALGSSLLYFSAPWKIRFAFNSKTALEILRFGIPFQFQQLSMAIGGLVTPVFVGTLIGPQAVGYINWASANGKKPFILVDNIVRVAFPHFSRIQNQPDEVQRILKGYLTWVLLMSAYWVAILVGAGHALVGTIYGNKWTPAVTALQWSGLILVVDVTFFMVMTTINSTGRIAEVTRAVLYRQVLNFVLSVVLVYKIGFIGVIIGNFSSGLVTLPILLKVYGYGRSKDILFGLAWILIPTGASVAAAAVLPTVGLSSPVKAIAQASVVTIVYAVTAWLVSPSSVRQAASSKLGVLGTPLLAWAQRSK